MITYALECCSQVEQKTEEEEKTAAKINRLCELIFCIYYPFSIMVCNFHTNLSLFDIIKVWF